jgi:hypothetical protein
VAPQVHPRFFDLHARVVSHETLAKPYLTLTPAGSRFSVRVPRLLIFSDIFANRAKKRYCAHPGYLFISILDIRPYPSRVFQLGVTEACENDGVKYRVVLADIKTPSLF